MESQPQILNSGIILKAFTHGYITTIYLVCVTFRVACTCGHSKTPKISLFNVYSQVKRYKDFECKILNIFLPISFNILFGCSKEPSH